MQKLQTALAQCKIVPVVVVNEICPRRATGTRLAKRRLTVVEVTLRTPAALAVISYPVMRQTCPKWPSVRARF